MAHGTPPRVFHFPKITIVILSLVAERLEDMREKLAKIGAFVAVAGMALTGLAEEASSFFEPGRIAVGCNYWASHAGVYMWRNWNPAQVEKDLDLMAAYGMTVLRVFPLWSDFQPLVRDCRFAGAFVDYLQADGPLKNYAAVDDEMMSRFRFLCDAAEKRGVKLIVGLITGWMSGRMFVPSAFENVDVLTDQAAIMWESRFVRYFIEKMKDHPAIIAWDLGNECDCMGKADQFQMWNWFHAISLEIKNSDRTRPVVSGLHLGCTKRDAPTNFRQMEELMDVLTTHPYPLWTPNCNLEEFNSIRNACHAPCETVMYSDLSGHPAFVEEAGSLGPSVSSEENAAATMRMQLFGSWAVGIPMYLWWCAFDQTHLDYAPYTRGHVERELGLFTVEGNPKPTALALKRFCEFRDALPFAKLPPRRIDAVVLSSEDEDAWPVLQHAWLLSRQAGFDIRYVNAERPLPDSDFYILPSGTSLNTYSRIAWLRVCEKAERGATVLVSLGNMGTLSQLRQMTGVETLNFYQRPRKVSFTVEGNRIEFTEQTTRKISAREAKVLIAEDGGEPLMTEFALGKGKMLFFNAALEANGGLSAWPIYELAARLAGVKRRVIVTGDARTLGLTEHSAKEGRTWVVAVNYDSKTSAYPIRVEGKVGRVLNGSYADNKLTVGPNDGCVFELMAN